MRIADLLRNKGELVRSVGAHVTVNAAIQLMAAHRIGGLLVFDQAATNAETQNDVVGLLGIVSEREIMTSLAKRGAAVLGAKVSEIMLVEIPFIQPADSIRQAMAVMTHEKTRYLPVVDSGKVVGLISIGDLVKSRLDEKTEENAILRDMARLSGLMAA